VSTIAHTNPRQVLSNPIFFELMIGDDDNLWQNHGNKETEILLLELKVLVAELRAGEITEEHYNEQRDALIVKLVEAR
jgi:hypothetical protein